MKYELIVKPTCAVLRTKSNSMLDAFRPYSKN